MLDGGTYAGQSASGQVNLAPLSPLLALKDKSNRKPYEDSTLVQIFRDFHNEIKNRHIEERREIAETAKLISNVRSGKLVMKRNPIHGGLALVKPVPIRPRTDRHVYPLAQVNSSQLTAIWTLSRPKALPRHFGNTNKAQIQHAVLEQIIEHYEGEYLGDEYFNQKESLTMMDYGTSIIRVSYDSRLNAISETKPIIEGVEQTLFEGYAFCPCGKEGTPEDFQLKGEAMPRCPDCGGYNISDPIEAQVISVPQIVGQRTYKQGDICIELLDVASSNWDMSKLVQHSDFFYSRSEVPLNFIRSILGCDIDEADPSIDTGQQVLNALGTRGGSAQGYGRENLDGHVGYSRSMKAYMEEEWYEPDWYAGLTLSKDEKTVSGEVIPKGVDLAKIFPDGACMVGFNDMQVPVALYNEKRTIFSSVYHIQSNSGVGNGISAIVDIAEQLNSAHSANLEVIKRHGAGGGVLYDRNVMSKSEAQAAMKPGKLTGVDLKSGGYTSVDQVIAQIKTGELNNSNLAMIAQLSNLMNLSSQTTDFTPGVADSNVNVNTLGGQQMLAAQNQQRAAAPLRMKGWLRAQVYQDGVLPLFRQHIKLPKWLSSTDRFGMTKGRMVSGKDLPERVRCNWANDSELPMDQMTKRNNISMLLEKVGLSGITFFDLAAAKPRIAAALATDFGADIPLFNHHDILIVCQDRIDELRELAAEAEQMAQMSGFAPPVEEIGGALVAGLQRRPVLKGEENLMLKAEVLGEYLDDDEAVEWSPAMRAGVQALIQACYMAAAQAEVDKARPMMEAEAQLQGQQAQAQAKAQMEQEAAAAEQEQMRWMADQVAAEDEFERAQQAEDMSASRELAMREADDAFEEKSSQRQLRMKKQEAEIDERRSGSDHKRDRQAAREDHNNDLKLERTRNANRSRNAGARPKPGGSKRR